MNNLTRTETLPKSGHVTEVCKEWLVREDSALAYKLQSQEINDFYKGNRFRNAVVREDFPTALNEQIKEKENADKQSEMYRQRLNEQEEHDKRVAKQIADRLERDLQEQQQRELQESERIAQQMQEIYVNLPPVPPPASRHGGQPPPRPAKASNSQNSPPTTHERHSSTSSGGRLQDCSYVSVSLAHGVCVEGSERYKQLQNGHHSSNNNNSHVMTPMRRQTSVSSSSGGASGGGGGGISPATPSSSTSSSSAGHRSRNVLDSLNIPSALTTSMHSSVSTPSTPQTPKTPNTSTVCRQPLTVSQPDDDEIEYADVADSIRHYDIQDTNSPSNNNNNSHSSLTRSTHSHHSQHLSTPMGGGPFAGDSPDAAPPKSAFCRVSSASSENLLRNENPKFQKLSPEKYDQLVGNGLANGGISEVERHMQAHADDIELYVDPCDYASLKDIGLPMHEIKELRQKLKQEQKDELLAQRLQEMEAHDGLSQEERDRLMAIEAQDKELAKMLQEREKAKAKRAKEKARLRKSQPKDAGASAMCPILSQDCCSASNSPYKLSAAASPLGNGPWTNGSYPEPVASEPLDMEAYSNPIDVLNNSQQRAHTSRPLTNGSLTRENGGRLSQRGEDDIYTLPVDSCRPTGHRPVSLSISGGELAPITAGHHQNSMTRSENYSIGSRGSGGDSAISNGSLLHGTDVSPRLNHTKSAAFDKSSSPTPPYMPIQGTRRSNSSEDRKKRSKYTCTHQ